MAIVDRDRSCSYRDLNYRANALARRLHAHGFRRGGHACVRLPRGINLATTLLAILKAGGSYTWSDSERVDSAEPEGVSIAVGIAVAMDSAMDSAMDAGMDRAETRHLHLDVALAAAERVACCPNLPILTRGTDVACVLQDDGRPVVIVPHATITALRTSAVTHPTSWIGEPGAFDLWMALMAGTTAIVEERTAASAAA